MIQLHRVLLAALILSLFAMTSADAVEREVEWEYTDIEGVTHRPFDEDSTIAVVLVFISTDCPIANAYQPVLQRMQAAHQESGIRFIMIHPNPDLGVEDARSHANEYRIQTPVVIDTDLSIARQVGATVTPQVFMFVRGEVMPVYSGRIDNLYAGFGRKRNVATSHELSDALHAIIDGKTVGIPKTDAVGCLITFPK